MLEMLEYTQIDQSHTEVGGHPFGVVDNSVSQHGSGADGCGFESRSGVGIFEVFPGGCHVIEHEMETHSENSLRNLVGPQFSGAVGWYFVRGGGTQGT